MSQSTIVTPPVNQDYFSKFSDLLNSNPPGTNKKLLDQVMKARAGGFKEYTRRWGSKYDENGNRIE